MIDCLKKPQLPGKNMIGRGIILKPYQHFELKSVIINPDEKKSQVFTSKNTNQTYNVPINYEIDESASMQGNQAIERTVIEESWEHIEQFFSVSPNIAASNHVFHLDMNIGITKPSSLFEYVYVLKSYSIPVWTLSFSNTSELSPAFNNRQDLLNIPTPFDGNKRRDYEKFFAQYGTHYVKKVWIGGKITFVLTIAKSIQLSKQEIRAAVHTMFGGFDNKESQKAQQVFDTLRNYLEQTQVVGQGGNKSTLSDILNLSAGEKNSYQRVLSFSANEKNSYQTWQKTVTQNPAVIEFDAVGIWTLISDDEKAKALREAYKFIFTSAQVMPIQVIPISAIIEDKTNLYFLRGKKYARYNTQSGHIEKCGDIETSSSSKALASLENCCETIEAALNLNNAIVFFHQNECFHYNLTQKKIEYSGLIKNKWDGLPFDRIDATLKMGDLIYFFRNNEYSRYNWQTKKVESSLKTIREGWEGVTFDKVDAAIWVEVCEKIYFVREDEYIRYDTKNGCADPYYPKKITDQEIDNWALEFAQLKYLLYDIGSQIKTAKGKKTIQQYSLISLVVGIMPAYLDVATLLGTQLKMLHSLANIYGIEFQREFVKLLIGTLVGGSSLWFSSRLAVFLKSIPIIGSIPGIVSQSVLSGASTYAVGKVFIQHFESGGTFLTFEPQKVSKYYAQQVEKGIEILKTNCALQ